MEFRALSTSSHLPPLLEGIYGQVNLPVSAPPRLQHSISDPAAARDGSGILATTAGVTHVASDKGIHVVCAGAAHGIKAPGPWLLQRYIDRGERAFDGLRGTLAAVIVDEANASVDVCVDRLGIRTTAYVLTGQHLRLAPSAEPLLDGDSQLNPQAIYNYFYHQMIPSPMTLYRDIVKLAPAERLHVSKTGAARTTRYWQPQFDRSRPPTHRELYETLRDAVSRSMASTPTAAFLSGGLDSSTVVGMAAAIDRERVRAFTIGFDEPGYDEVPFARATAAHFGVELIEKYVTPDDVIDTLAHIAEYYDEPFGNSSAIPTYHCSRLAASHGHTRILAGDGGDELFAGNARYQMQLYFSHYQRLPQPLRARLIEPLLFNWLAGTTLFPIPKARGYVSQANTRMPDRTQSYNFLHRNHPGDVFTPEFLAGTDQNSPLQHLRDVWCATPDGDELDHLLFSDWKLTLADNDLKKVTGMCSSAELEVAYPMLDDAVVALSTRIPSSAKLSNTELRKFYRRALRDFLPRSTLKKSKHGFGIPFGSWLQKSDRLRELVVANLSSFAERGVVQRSYIDELVGTIQGQHAAYYGEMIWLILTLEQWLQARPRLAAQRF